MKEWVDLSGMLAPKNEIELLIARTEKNEFTSIEDLSENLRNLYSNYDKYSFDWTVGLIEKLYDIKISEFSKVHLSQIITDWKINSIKLNNMILNDANKEFDSKSQIGFGIDGDEETKIKDFNEVRGTFEQNNFVNEIRTETEHINKTADELIRKLELVQ